MKKNFTLMVLLLLSAGASAQYLNNTSRWYFRGGYFDMISTSYTYDWLYYIDGDTTVNDLLYYKLYVDKHDTAYNFQIDETTTTIVLHAQAHLLREEDNRFYQAAYDNEVEELTFDFNLYEEGATVATAEDACGFEMTVETIDTVYFGNEARARYFFEGTDIHYVIEGVGGGSNGFTLGCPGMIGIEGGFYPVCYSINGYTQPLSFQQEADCAMMPTGIIGPDPLRDVTIYPNPSSGLCMLANLPADAKVKLFDMHGRICPVVMSHSMIDLREKSPGVYMLQIESGRHVTMQRIVKTGL